MAFDYAAWMGLALRWLHLIAGVAWIGASFYFVWLDNNLTPPDPPKPGVKGELWAVHGGGFYHSQKYMVAPPDLPDHLHWFKWEAYTTWLSGFALLCVVYYWGAPVYLIDTSKVAFTHLAAVAVGLAFIAGGLAVYEALCRSPLLARPRVFGAVWFLSLTAAAYALTRLFSDRGAFIHVGAIIGTCMVGNVFLVIIPNQAKIVAAMRAGHPIDPRLGAAGKLRSVHNNYMTLPVLFIMISNHYPMVTGHALSWLLLALLAAAGVSIRHFFNLRHFGRTQPGYLGLGAALFVAVAVIATIKPPAAAPLAAAPAATSAAGVDAAPVAVGGPIDFASAQAILRKHCVMCHAATPTHAGFSAPPAGVVFDTPAHIATLAPRIQAMAVDSRTMPLGNETGMTDDERARLGAWIKAGAPTH